MDTERVCAISLRITHPNTLIPYYFFIFTTVSQHVYKKFFL